MGERLQKYLARCGAGSRRLCEKLITAGKVQVNGHTIRELGSQIEPGDRITLHGKPIYPEKLEYILLHKPVGVVSTVHDPQRRKTVLDLLPDDRNRLYPVGRLDYDSSGLLLLTNDGALTFALTHPSKGVEKVYRVKVKGVPDQHAREHLKNGIELADGKTSPAKVQLRSVAKDKKSAELDITIHEGKNRQVRRMMEAVNHPVLTLKRIRFGPLSLDKLPEGNIRYLTRTELLKLYKAAGFEDPGKNQ